VSANGTIYVADSFHRVIRVYSPQHRLVGSWPVTFAGTSGAQLAVAVGGGGTVLVAAAPQSRCTFPDEKGSTATCATSYVVQRRSPSGRLLGQFQRAVASFGVPNALVLQLSVAVNGAGDIYVAVDGWQPYYRGYLIYHFLIEHEPDGRVLGHWGAAGLNETTHWSAVAIGGRGNIFLADDSYYHRIEKRSRGGQVLADWPLGTLFSGPIGCGQDVLAPWKTINCEEPPPGPAGVTVARNGTIYASDPRSGRVQVLSPSGRLLAEWGTGGAAPGRFRFPTGVALDATGQLWVDDMVNGRVQTLGADGLFHVRFAVPNPGTGMALDRQGNVYIGQQLGQQIGQDVVLSTFSPSGKLLARWSNLDMAAPPTGIAVAPNGDVVITGYFNSGDPKKSDLNGSTILRLSPTGKPLSHIHLGDINLGYNFPSSGIAVDAHEDIIIAYGTNPHVDRYSSSGQLLASWGAPKPVVTKYGFPSPAFIGLDAVGDIYMADTLRNVVQEYGANGSILHTWGGSGSYVGQFHHSGGIAVAPNGTIYVSDTENHRIQRLLR
jgi:DNA-binding beta-propeller fold protein YncE